MIEAFRISAAQHARTVQKMLSGRGAFLNGGRWNSPGVAMVYLAGSRSLAALELLVHLNRTDILKTYKEQSVSFSESLVTHIAVDDLPSNWSKASMAPVVQQIGDAWARENVSLVLQVPSVVVSGEYNYLINPEHDDFHKMCVGKIARFKFDCRLKKRQ